MKTSKLRIVVLLLPLLFLPTIWFTIKRDRTRYSWLRVYKRVSEYYDHQLQQADMRNCSADGYKLVGTLFVNKTSINNMSEIENEMAERHGGWVREGGASRPEHCRPLRKLAIIIPYRKRYEHLKLFLRHMHPILKRQLSDYRIFTVEQTGTTRFNRALLFNIGFKESQRFDNYDCFVFHDVDLLPENDQNMYDCWHSPRHMCPAIDTHHYRLMYGTLFGGVEAILRKHFKLINGFSNKYFGWGGEDDDLYKRVRHKGLRISRPSMTIGRYKMVKNVDHYSNKGARNSSRTRMLLRSNVKRMDFDGLNSLKYKLLRIDTHLLYTHIAVEVDLKNV